MTEQECGQVYEELLAILEQTRLGWVVVQLQDQIRFGVPVEREVSAPTQPGLVGDPESQGKSIRRRKRQSKITFISTRPFTARERLLLLVEAMKQAVVNTGEMEQALLHAFAEYTGRQVDRVEFRAEDATIAQTSLTSHEASTRADPVAIVRGLLDELRQDANSAD